MPVALDTTPFQPLSNGRAPGRPLFAIGDVHGHADALDRLLEHLAALIGRDYSGREVDLVFLGDFVDRGRKPKETLDLVRRGLGVERVREHRLLGNHDRYLAQAAGLRGGRLDLPDWAVWIANGGRETMAGLGGLPLRAAPERVREALGEENVALLETLELSMASGDVFCAHAGVRPDRLLADQTEQDLVWIREPFLSAAERADGDWMPGAYIVHGHSPHAYGVYEHRVGADTGGFATGVFTAAEICEQGVRLHHLKAT